MSGRGKGGKGLGKGGAKRHRKILRDNIQARLLIVPLFLPDHHQKLPSSLTSATTLPTQHQQPPTTLTTMSGRGKGGKVRPLCSLTVVAVVLTVVLVVRVSERAEPSVIARFSATTSRVLPSPLSAVSPVVEASSVSLGSSTKRRAVSSRSSSRTSSAIRSLTLSTPSARLLLRSTSSTPSSARAARSTVSVLELHELGVGWSTATRTDHPYSFHVFPHQCTLYCTQLLFEAAGLYFSFQP
uniref:Histone H4 n=1 Tax=Mycena chlorophos TaxID=658473 RepID=A0ABQ0LL54_MYCCL|nr:predicted protein [Mycena chlorophos]